LLDSDLSTRVSEGTPGDRDYPPSPINAFSDRLEAIVIGLARALYRVPFVEWRAHSNSVANLLAVAALTNPGDLIMVQAPGGGGGNMGFLATGFPSLRGLRVVEMPAADLYSVDVAELEIALNRHRPKVLIVGGGQILFPYPLQEICRLARNAEATVIYDAAHVGMLIAHGLFQDPWADGVDVLTTGTHKISSGPVGGLVMSQDRDTIARVAAFAYPGLIQTRDQNKFAAAAYSLAEMLAFGKEYATQAISNAQALGEALVELGFGVIGSGRGYTQTHQVIVDLRPLDATSAASELIAAGLLVHPTSLPLRRPDEPKSGLRLSVQEATRRGLKEPEMREVARLFERVLMRREASLRVAKDVHRLMSAFPTVAFTFADANAPLSPMGLA
jgi:glycine hydroxymethyltransferase